MATLNIPKINDSVIGEIKLIAHNNNRSMAAQVRVILAEYVDNNTPVDSQKDRD